MHIVPFRYESIYDISIYESIPKKRRLEKYRRFSYFTSTPNTKENIKTRIVSSKIDNYSTTRYKLKQLNNWCVLLRFVKTF